MDNISIDVVLSYCKNITDVDKKLIVKAYEYASICHKDQVRESGEKYIIHPLNVAFTLASLKQDTNTICAGLLHDVVEDTNTTVSDLKNFFNNDIAMLVDGVTKLNDPSASSRKLLTKGLLEDPRIIIIKLADRLHNMRTLEYKSEEKRKEKAIETMEFYTPLAYYTGVYSLKMELEDLSFKYIKPDEFKKLEEQRNDFELDNQKCVEEVLDTVYTILSSNNINSELIFKTKNIYRIYRSLISHDTNSLYEIPSMLVFKVIVEDIVDCYKSLGFIHSLYHPVNAKFKDFICNPKANGYQSLLTTLNGPFDKLVQAHIRTKEMDRVADYGIFAKTGNRIKEDVSKREFYNSLVELNNLYTDNNDFLSSVKDEIFTDTVCVETTKGDIIELPKGSTIIDFAYKIHSDVGNEMVAAIVNNKVVDFNYILKDKDRVRIVCDKYQAQPQEEWIDYAKTSHARQKIKKYLKNT